MSDYFKKIDFSNFGVIANSIGPTPDDFLIKEITEQNTFIPSININNYNNENIKENYNFLPNIFETDNKNFYNEDNEDYDEEDDEDYEDYEIDD